MRREGRYGGYPWSRSHSSNNENNNNSSSNEGKSRWAKKSKLLNISKKSPSPDDLFDSVIETEADSEKLVDVSPNPNLDQPQHIGQEGSAHGNSIPLMPRNKPSSSRTLASGGVTVKTDIVVKVDEESHIPPRETPSPFARGDGKQIDQRASAFAWPHKEGFDNV